MWLLPEEELEERLQSWQVAVTWMKAVPEKRETEQEVAGGCVCPGGLLWGADTAAWRAMEGRQLLGLEGVHVGDTASSAYSVLKAYGLFAF